MFSLNSIVWIVRHSVIGWFIIQIVTVIVLVAFVMVSIFHALLTAIQKGFAMNASYSFPTLTVSIFIKFNLLEPIPNPFVKK